MNFGPVEEFDEWGKEELGMNFQVIGQTFCLNGEWNLIYVDGIQKLLFNFV